MGFKITYSVLDADMEDVHRQFDTALEAAKAEIGGEYTSFIGGEAHRTGDLIASDNPADTRVTLANVHAAGVEDVDRIMEIAQRGQRSWSKVSWQEKVATLNRAADIISSRAPKWAAIMAMEVGKNRMEALGEVEEAADLLRYYSGQLEQAEGFVKPLTKLSPNEDTRSVLRPFGVFLVIAPFNYPMALAAGMISGALLGGNSVVFKPSEDTPWCASLLYQAFMEGGVPSDALQIVHGRGETVGDALVHHPAVDGAVFTGSRAVGHRIYRAMTGSTVKPWIRPCFLEMGGKNAAIVDEGADLQTAITGCYKSAFGLTGQKCSALSRIYVHASLRDELVAGITAMAADMVVGDPTRREVFMGPAINDEAVARFVKASQAAKADGTVLFGGERLTGGEFDHGRYVAPTLVEVPRDHWLETTELFLPFSIVSTFTDRDDVMTRVNAVEYGLTGGYYGAQVDWYLDHVEAGCLYTNRAAGATTGAWPGVQAFCGWKNSGSTGKGFCGPYYVSQYMREQSHTRVM